MFIRIKKKNRPYVWGNVRVNVKGNVNIVNVYGQIGSFCIFKLRSNTAQYFDMHVDSSVTILTLHQLKVVFEICLKSFIR